MSAGKFKTLVFSIAVLAGVETDLPAQQAHPIPRVTARTETDLAPRANRALPQKSPVAAQKPTSEAPAGSGIVRADWVIPAAEPKFGNRKPAQTQETAASAPTESHPTESHLNSEAIFASLLVKKPVAPLRLFKRT